ncbi:MAG TPA: hypothetical protein VMC42_07325 [Methanoregulaceae archaeon]|nr:hypothetical protein [Methanoregulaceae archaeon]
MPDIENPYDDFLKNLAKLVEDIVKNIPDSENARFIGCTIIAGGGNGLPRAPGISGGKREIRYEMIDTEDRIFITAEIPSEIKNAPYADISPDSVRICIDEMNTAIPFEEKIDVIHSFYMVRHGVMDIVLRKDTSTRWV